MTTPRRTPIDVVGIGADGWEGLSPASREVLAAADVVFGSARQLHLLPVIEDQHRIGWPSPMLPALEGMLARHNRARRAVLASGDPLLSGLGTTLIRLCGAEAVRIHPAVSSVALALAEMRWPWDDTEIVTVVGRPLERVLLALAPGAHVLVLSSDHATPAAIAPLLRAAGYGPSRLTVLGDLGTSCTFRKTVTADDWDDGHDVPALNIVAIDCAAADPAAPRSATPGLPDDAFCSDGQLTKRDVRASAMSRLAPRAGELLWDLGAGTGTVGIEWMRQHPRNRAHAVERDGARAVRIETNARRLGVPGLAVHRGSADELVENLPDPDAIFVGGGATATLIERCLHRLPPGGRLVAHAVTVQTEALLIDSFHTFGGELTRVSVEHLEPLGGLHGWRPARPITQWGVIR